MVEIPQIIGVQQGENMTPVPFLFLVTEFAETREVVWKHQEIPILSVMTASEEHLIDGKYAATLRPC